MNAAVKVLATFAGRHPVHDHGYAAPRDNQVLSASSACSRVCTGLSVSNTRVWYLFECTPP